MDTTTLLAFQLPTICFSILSMSGNAVVIASIFSLSRNRRTIHMLTKLSLAGTNVCSTLTVIISIVHFHVSFTSYSSYEYDELFLNMWFYDSLHRFFCSASFYNVSLLALQRLYAIKYPYKYTRISKKKHILWLVISWALGAINFVLYTLVYVIGVTELIFPTEILASTVPFIITLISTIAICLVYINYTRSSTFNSNDNTVVSRQHDHSAVTKVTSLIAVSYIVTCGPLISCDLYFLIITCAGKDWTKDNLGMFLQQAANIFYSLNGLVDVIIYRVLDNHFKKYCKSLFAKLHCSTTTTTEGDSAAQVHSLPTVYRTDLT